MPRFTHEVTTLLSNAGATGAGQVFGGGKAYWLMLAGTGGATVALQVLGPDDATWVAVPSASSASSTVAALDLPPGTYRTTVTGGTTPAGIYSQLRGQPA